MKTLSIVTTLYYSAPYIREFYGRITNAAQKITEDYEIIFVNDGSPDRSLEIAISLYELDAKVSVIDLSRNFGHHKAMMTGLSRAAGEFVFLIDADLEERPELLNEFWSELQGSKNVDVVFGIQARRKGGWFERLSGEIFYNIFNFFSDIKVPRNVTTARLMKREYVTALLSFKEQEIFLAGLWASAGFNQKGILVEKLSNSPTTYSPRKKVAIFANSLTSFTSQPLLHIFFLGCLISTISFAYIGYLVFRKLYYGTGLVGWTSLIASIWLVGGIIIFSIGTLGIYLAKIFSEVKNRPYTIAKRYYKRDNP